MRRRPGHKIIFCGDEPAQHQPVGLPQPIREGSCFACDIIKEPRASTMQRCNIETTSLHYLLNANDAVVQVMDAVLFRLPAVERARLYALLWARVSWRPCQSMCQSTSQAGQARIRCAQLSDSGVNPRGCEHCF